MTKTFPNSNLLLCFIGYEHYKTMRADPCLCFVSKVGLPTDMNDSTAGEPTDPDDRQVHEVFLKTFLRLFLCM